MRIGSLFSGYGGLEQGVQSVLGGTVAWHSEIDPGACKILAHRYPDVPNLGDITVVDWAAVEPVDVLTGGFPCQDLSVAGLRRGLAGARSGLWAHMAGAIDALRPGAVFIENVRGILSAEAVSDLDRDGLGAARLRALGAVLGDLADIGYDAAWCGLHAADVGAPHPRPRVFIFAWPASDPDYARWVEYGGAGADAAEDDPAQRSGDTAISGAAAWGRYADAIRRWERATGRAAPAPVEDGSGSPRLNACAVEWLMGLPAGWVTDVQVESAQLDLFPIEYIEPERRLALRRTEQLRILGNGVVPQQAAAALRWLLSQAGQIPERCAA